MKNYFLLTALLMLSSQLNAQSHYYWYQNHKVFLDLKVNKKFILVEYITDSTELKQKLNLPNSKVHVFSKTLIMASLIPHKSEIQIESKWAVIEDSRIDSLELLENENIIYISPFYNTELGIEAGLSHLFYVKLHDSSDLRKLEEMSTINKVTILGNNKFMPNWYTLACSKYSKGNALEMANIFYESCKLPCL
jgi:hypothetical protein